MRDDQLHVVKDQMFTNLLKTHESILRLSFSGIHFRTGEAYLNPLQVIHVEMKARAKREFKENGAL